VVVNGDRAFIAKALDDIGRACDMTKVARDSGLSKDSLYKALTGDISRSFYTINKDVPSWY